MLRKDIHPTMRLGRRYRLDNITSSRPAGREMLRSLIGMGGHSRLALVHQRQHTSD